MPLSFLTGFRGMNLHHVPELVVPYAQEFALLLMVAVTGTMLYIFRRRGRF